MTDYISRADAIEAVAVAICKDEDEIEAIKAIPSAEAEWIQVSERLPSEDGQYLVCMNFEYDNMDVLMWSDGWNCFKYPDGKISRESEIDGEDILAWMPLPTPYKGGEE